MIRSLLCSLLFPVLLFAQTEDFTTYTEVDENADISVVTDTITVSTMAKTSDGYVYFDKTAGHFDGDFTHLGAYNVDDNQNNAQVQCWAMSNSLGSQNDIDVAGGDVLSLEMLGSNPTPTMFVIDIDAGTFNNSSGLALAEDTDYWSKIVRDESISANGDLAISIYSNASRTTLVGTRNLNLSSSKKDFRYIYGMMGTNVASGDDWTGKIYELDLQEVKRRKQIL